MKRYIVRLKSENNWQAIRAYASGAWEDLPKSARSAVKQACFSKEELRESMVIEISFKRVRKK
jgi:hypothetical protein